MPISQLSGEGKGGVSPRSGEGDGVVGVGRRREERDGSALLSGDRDRAPTALLFYFLLESPIFHPPSDPTLRLQTTGQENVRSSHPPSLSSSHPSGSDSSSDSNSNDIPFPLSPFSSTPAPPPRAHDRTNGPKPQPFGIQKCSLVALRTHLSVAVVFSSPLIS